MVTCNSQVTTSEGSMTALEEIQGAVGRLAAEIGPKVVGVGRFGSGVIVAEGLVLTNAHVVRREQVRVTLADGRRTPGVVAGLDADGDLAVVSIETDSIEPVEWADGTEPAVGTAVF